MGSVTYREQEMAKMQIEPERGRGDENVDAKNARDGDACVEGDEERWRDGRMVGANG
jgi:hypothetical protein